MSDDGAAAQRYPSISKLLAEQIDLLVQRP